MDTYSIQRLQAQWITPEGFRPYGQLITPIADGKLYCNEDAQLVLNRGIPRFYLMRLFTQGRKFYKITRHNRCTQCLGSLEGKDWLLAVAPASNLPEPAMENIKAFRIPGNCFIKLDVGTWHAGPYFDANFVDFYNLELSDTNTNDHETCNLLKVYSVEFEIV